MLSDATAPRPLALLDQVWLQRALPAFAAVLAIAVLTLPAWQAAPAPLTSDESLYLAEGYNIAAGHGPTYPTGELVNHRAPLQPALLSIPIRLTDDPESAYWVSKLIVVALIGAAFLLTQQLFGTLAGTFAALLVASSAFLRWLGTTLYLDGAETLFLLLFLFTLWRAFQTETFGWFLGAGALLGLAFLVKEAAVQWLPLPVAFALLSPQYRNRRVVRGLALYGAAAGSILAPWWLWVYAATGGIYFWGKPDAQLAALTVACVAGAAGIGLAGLVLRQLAPQRLGPMATACGVAIVLGWAAATFLGIKLTSWPVPNDYWHTVPQYLREVVAPNSQPWPLAALAVLWLSLRATKDAPARLVVLGLVLFLPFAVAVANRSLAYRDLLPMLYLAYVAAGALAAQAFHWTSTRAGVFPAAAVALAGIAAFGFLQTQDLVDDWLPYDRTAIAQSNWDNPLVHDTAAWLHEQVPPGAPIMSSRLYYSQLYVLDRARHPIYQLPTVRVEPQPGEAPFLRRVSTLFRWEDHRLGEPQPDERWLYVKRYPFKGYYVAFSERDLLRDLRERDVDYLVLTGQDAGFSSLSYLDYFEANPAFELVHKDVRSSADAVYVFRVYRERLESRPYRAAVSPATLDGLLAAWHGASRETAIRAIDPDGVNVGP